MDLTDIRIILIFATIAGVTAFISSTFGTKGTLFILTVHTLMNSFFVNTSLIANGKI